MANSRFAADGNLITNPGGFVHNGGSYKDQQTDSSFFGAGTVNFYSSDGSTLDAKTYDDFLTHYNTHNGAYNLWIKVNDDNLIVEAVQYALDKEWTPSQYLRNVRYFGGTLVIPIQPVVDGIGPNNDWFTYDGIHVTLVEDA